MGGNDDYTGGLVFEAMTLLGEMLGLLTIAGAAVVLAATILIMKYDPSA